MNYLRLSALLATAGLAAALSGCVVAPIDPGPVAVYPGPSVYVDPAPVVVVPGPGYYGGFYGFRGYRGHGGYGGYRGFRGHGHWR
jgi:hypothetical protein